MTGRKKIGPKINPKLLLKPLMLIFQNLNKRGSIQDKTIEEIKDIAKFPPENPNPVLRIGSDGKILWANEAAKPLCKAWGCEVGSVTPTKFLETITDAGKASRTQNIELAAENKTFLFSIVPIVGEGYVNMYGFDITLRKKIEKQIENANIEWERTFNSISDFVFIQDKDYKITKVNKAFAKLVGGNPEEIIGKECYRIVHGKDDVWEGCPFNKVSKTKAPDTYEIDNSIFGIPLSVTVSPIIGDKGEVVGTVHIMKDMSVHKKHEEELEKHQKELAQALAVKTEFTSTVSHELRTPLTAIKEGISIVADGTAGKLGKEQKEFLDIAKRNVDRLGRLINDVLDFQKLESGKITLDMNENDLEEVMNEVKKSMLPLIKQKGLTFHVEVSDDIPLLEFDRDKIIQVFNNLIKNAVEATKKGSITIVAKKVGNTVRVSVIDTGHGIEKKDLQRVFHGFEQIGGQKYRKIGSTGLGLAICKEIIEKHEGKIWVKSEVGKGSTFTFLLSIIERRKSGR